MKIGWTKKRRKGQINKYTKRHLKLASGQAFFIYIENTFLNFSTFGRTTK